MHGMGFLMVGLGAVLGAWSRWLLGVSLNHMWISLPLGTLIANLVGGYLIGLVLGLVQAGLSLTPEVKLLIMTGFLGGLTTFSTFSAEATELLMKGQWGLGLVHIAVHLMGSLLLTILGIYSARLIIN